MILCDPYRNRLTCKTNGSRDNDDNNNGVFVILIAKTMLFTLIKSGAIITLKCSEIDI